VCVCVCVTPPLLSHYVDDFSDTVILLKTTACYHLKSDKTTVIMGLLAIYTGLLGRVVRPSMLVYIAKRPTMNAVLYLYWWLLRQNITLINKTKFLNDTDFIIRMLYKYSYWHTIYNLSTCMIISLLLHPAAVLFSSNVHVFAILETFIVLSVSLLLCMYII